MINNLLEMILTSELLPLNYIYFLIYCHNSFNMSIYFLALFSW